MGDVQKPNVSVEILERLKALDNLPHFPGTLLKLDREIANNDNISIDEVVDLVAQDARLVAGLIKLANSAKYSMGEEIQDLGDAVFRIGYRELGNLAHAIHFQSAFKRKPPFSDAHYLKHALLSAFLAQQMAPRLKLDAGAAFLAALMRDIGIYLLAMDDRDKYLEVIKLAQYDITKLPVAENKVFGTYHALMSARLLQEWKFPSAVVIGVAFHHTPEKANENFKDYAYLTYLAEQGVFRMGYENGVADITDEERETPSESLMNALKYFDLTLDEYDEFIAVASEEMANLNF